MAAAGPSNVPAGEGAAAAAGEERMYLINNYMLGDYEFSADELSDLEWIVDEMDQTEVERYVLTRGTDRSPIPLTFLDAWNLLDGEYKHLSAIS